MREGAAARPLPERSPPPDQPATAPVGRHLRGDRLGHRDRRGGGRASAQVRDTHGGASIFYYGGGGQGNHLGGAYSGGHHAGARRPLPVERPGPGEDRRVLGQRPDARHEVRGDFEHAEVALFVGKNPWQTHGIPRARTTLKEIARDPDRAMIVIDPRRTETADLADFHLPVRPGTDAWCLAALGAVLVQEGLVDRLMARRAHGRARRGRGDVRRRRRWPQYAAVCGVDEDLLRRDGSPPRPGLERRRVRGPRRPDEPPLDAVELPGEAGLAADGNFGQARHAVRRRPRLVDLARGDSGGKGGKGGADQPGRRCPHHLRAGALQRDRRGDPHRSPGSLPGHARGERQPGALAGRQHRMREALASLGPGGRDRRGHDRDRPPGRLRAAGAVAVREVGGHVLQLRVPARTCSTCAGRCSTPLPTACSPSRRSTPAWSRRSARSPRTTSPRCGPRRPRVGRRSPTPSSRPRPPTLRSARWPRSCSTARSARRCPTGRRRPPCCGERPTAAP